MTENTNSPLKESKPYVATHRYSSTLDRSVEHKVDPAAKYITPSSIKNEISLTHGVAAPSLQFEEHRILTT